MARFFVILLVMILPFSALAEGRVALLLGNAQYDMETLVLGNPVNDVVALQGALEALGFEVFPVIDQDKAGMEAALDQFAIAAQNAEMAVFFYAGHGVQISGENHLIARDFDDLDDNGLAQSSITMTRVREVFEAAAPDIGIVILDACRNNPFVETGQAVRGLARSQGGAGLLIAYATDPGNVAYDGSGQNSVFTQAIVDHIATQGLDARIMFGRVRQQVIMQTRGEQIPWVEEAVLGEHYFAGRTGVVTAGSEYSAELQKWREISVQTDIAAFEDYLVEFPDGVFAQFAKDRIAMIRQARAAGAPSGQTSIEILKYENPEQVEAALAVLGFTQSTRDLAEISILSLANAFDLYRVQLPNPDEASAARLYEDAARMTIFLGAATAEQLRDDIIALSAIDRTLKIASDALREIEDIALTNAAAIPILTQARRDVTAIEANLASVLERLDESRLYYQSLINQAQDYFPDRIDTALLDSTLLQSGKSRLEQRLVRDAALFVGHVRNNSPETEGTYAWLTDFLPQN